MTEQVADLRASIKVKAFAVLVNRAGTHHLVWRGYDDGRPFQRLLGGHLEFGESTADCVVREIDEELGVGLLGPRLLGVLENVFEYAGEPGHEIVFVYSGDLDDPDTVPPDGRWFTDGEERLRAEWRPIAVGPDDEHASIPLYPTGLQELLPPAGILDA